MSYRQLHVCMNKNIQNLRSTDFISNGLKESCKMPSLKTAESSS